MSGKEWFYFSASLLSIFTFIMVAIIFFTGVAVAVRVANYLDRGQSVIDQLIEWVKRAEEALRQFAGNVRQRAVDADIPARVKSGVGVARNRTANAAQAAREQAFAMPRPADPEPPKHEDLASPFYDSFNAKEYKMLY